MDVLERWGVSEAELAAARRVLDGEPSVPASEVVGLLEDTRERLLSLLALAGGVVRDSAPERRRCATLAAC